MTDHKSSSMSISAIRPTWWGVCGSVFAHKKAVLIDPQIQGERRKDYGELPISGGCFGGCCFLTFLRVFANRSSKRSASAGRPCSRNVCTEPKIVHRSDRHSACCLCPCAAETACGTMSAKATSIGPAVTVPETVDRVSFGILDKESLKPRIDPKDGRACSSATPAPAFRDMAESLAAKMPAGFKKKLNEAFAV